MAVNRRKQSEDVIKEGFERVHNVSIDRLHDQTTGFKGSTNICDFIVYQKPFQYYIECKSIHGNTLSIFGTKPENKYGNITNKQWEGLLEKSKIYGCVAGIMCWWVDRDVTLFIDIRLLQLLREGGYKSIRYDLDDSLVISVPGTKKRVFFDYDMKYFLDRMEIAYAGKH
jgi:hypothetical protein